jgi:hypothetical protein
MPDQLQHQGVYVVRSKKGAEQLREYSRSNKPRRRGWGNPSVESVTFFCVNVQISITYKKGKKREEGS